MQNQLFWDLTIGSPLILTTVHSFEPSSMVKPFFQEACQHVSEFDSQNFQPNSSLAKATISLRVIIRIACICWFPDPSVCVSYCIYVLCRFPSVRLLHRPLVSPLGPSIKWEDDGCGNSASFSLLDYILSAESIKLWLLNGAMSRCKVWNVYHTYYSLQSTPN